MPSDDTAAKKLALADALRAYWARREARGQEASIPPPLETDPPAPPVSGTAPALESEKAMRAPTSLPTDAESDGISFAEFRLRLLRKRRLNRS